MSATHLDQITDRAIIDRLTEIASVSVSWTSSMPADTERWDAAANDRLPDVGVAEVRRALAHDLCGDAPVDEIDMAISIACEPEDLPENACVDLVFA